MDNKNMKALGLHRFFLLLLCFVIPVIFSPKLSDVFNLPKLVFLKTCLVIMLFPVFYRAVSKNRLSFELFPFFIPLCTFLAILLLSCFFSPYPSLSFQEFITTLAFAAFSYLVFHYTPLTFIAPMFAALMVSTFIVSAYAIFQHLGIDPVSWDDPNIRFRSTSTLGNPDFLGAYLAMVFPLLLALTLRTSRPVLKTLYLIFLFALFTALMFTFSRGAWLCFASGLAAFIMLSGRELFQANKKTLAVLLIGMLVLFALVSKEKIIIDKKETTAAQRLTSTVQMSYPSIAIRRHLWHDTLHMIRAKPLTGFGPGNYTLFFPPFRSPELLSLAGRLSLPESAHNDYLQHAVDAGFFSFFAFTWLLACAFLYGMKKRASSPEKIFNAAPLAALCAFAVENLFYFHVAPTYFLLFLCLGILPSAAPPGTRGKEQAVALPFSRLSGIILKICIPLLCLAMILNVIAPLASDYAFRQGMFQLERAGRAFRKGTFEPGIEEYEKAERSLLYAKGLAPREKMHGAYLGKCYEEMALLMASAPKKLDAEKKRFFLLALNEYRDVVKMYPNLAFVYADMGRLTFEMFQAGADKKGLETSIRHYEKALRYDPHNSMLYNDLGRVILARMDFKKARAYFIKAITLEPGFAEAHSNLGLIYYTEKNKKKARLHFLMALKTDPAHFDALARLGVMAYEEKKYSEALDYFKKASKLRPEDSLLPQKIKEMEKQAQKS